MSPLSRSGRRTSRRTSRRSFLASLGASTVVLSSGCVDGIRGGSSRPRLGWLAVKNYHPGPQRIEIQVLREESVVHESSHEIAGKQGGRIPGDVLECTWGDDPGPYVLRGRLAGGEWRERSVARTIEDSAVMDETTECVIAEGAYARYGSHRLSWLIQGWCGEVPSYDGGCSFANEAP